MTKPKLRGSWGGKIEAQGGLGNLPETLATWSEHFATSQNPLQFGQTPPQRMRTDRTGYFLWKNKVTRKVGSLCSVEKSDPP